MPLLGVRSDIHVNGYQHYERPSTKNIITAIALAIITNVGAFFIFSPIFAVPIAFLCDAIIYKALLSGRYHNDHDERVVHHVVMHERPATTVVRHIVTPPAPPPASTVVMHSPPSVGFHFGSPEPGFSSPSQSSVGRSPAATSVVNHMVTPPRRQIAEQLAPPMPDTSPSVGFHFGSPEPGFSSPGQSSVGGRSVVDAAPPPSPSDATSSVGRRPQAAAASPYRGLFGRATSPFAQHGFFGGVTAVPFFGGGGPSAAAAPPPPSSGMSLFRRGK